MSSIKKAVVAALIATGGVVLVAFLSFALVPGAAVERMLNGFLEQKFSVGLKSNGFGKVFPFGVRIEKPVFFSVEDSRGIVSLDRLTIRFKPLNLLYGELRFDAIMEHGAGMASSRISVGRNSAHAEAALKDMGVKAFHDEAGADGFLTDGLISGNLNITIYNDRARCPEGSMRLTALGLEFGGLYAGMPGMAGKMDAKAAADLNGCSLTLNDIWLTSERMRSRVSGAISLSGDIKKSGLDLYVEVFPEKAGEAMMMLFSGYKRTRNSYSMQIKGTVETPRIEGRAAL